MEPETVFTDDDPEFEALVADAKSGKIDNGLKATLYEVRSMQSCYRILHEGRTFELGIRMEWWGKRTATLLRPTRLHYGTISLNDDENSTITPGRTNKDNVKHVATLRARL